MPGYAQAQRARGRQESTTGGAADHRVDLAGRDRAAAPLGAALNESPRSQSLMQLRAALDASPRVQTQLALQRALDKRKRPGKEAPVQKKPNATGMPDRLKAGVEQLSGLAMDDVRVHYNSSKPAAVQAHAYAQGTDIHLAPGQEQHLPHEAWHVVQQKQGRVKPTLQMKGAAINDDAGLEREADVMGDRALAARTVVAAEQSVSRLWPAPDTVVQRGGGGSKSKSEAPQEGANIRYQMKEPVQGIRLMVSVKWGPGVIRLETGTQREVDAHLKYEIDRQDKTVLWLNHFECHPPGIGLGTLLMFELACVAKENGIKVIKLGSAAPTAVGAYEVFGATFDKGTFEQKIGPQKDKFADKERHAQFLHFEAEDIANQTVERAEFLNPDLSKDELKKLWQSTYDKHIAGHSNSEDAERVARLHVLASLLTFDPDALFEKTWASVDKKWDMNV